MLFLKMQVCNTVANNVFATVRDSLCVCLYVRYCHICVAACTVPEFCYLCPHIDHKTVNALFFVFFVVHMCGFPSKNAWLSSARVTHRMHWKRLPGNIRAAARWAKLQRRLLSRLYLFLDDDLVRHCVKKHLPQERGEVEGCNKTLEGRERSKRTAAGATTAEPAFSLLVATFCPCPLGAARGEHDAPRPRWLSAVLLHAEEIGGGGALATLFKHTNFKVLPEFEDISSSSCWNTMYICFERHRSYVRR